MQYGARNGTDLRLPSLDQSAAAAVVTKLAPGAPPVRAHVVAMRPGNMTCQLEHAEPGIWRSNLLPIPE